jgi:hypothetical protein
LSSTEPSASSSSSKAASSSFTSTSLHPIFRTDCMQHSFNLPFQLTSLRSLLEVEQICSYDSPEIAQTRDVCLQEGGMFICEMHSCSLISVSHSKLVFANFDF